MDECVSFIHSIYKYYNNVKMYCHVYLIPYEIIRAISTSWGTPRMPKVYPRASGRDSGPLASLGPLLDLGAGSTGGGPKAYSLMCEKRPKCHFLIVAWHAPYVPTDGGTPGLRGYLMCRTPNLSYTLKHVTMEGSLEYISTKNVQKKSGKIQLLDILVPAMASLRFRG